MRMEEGGGVFRFFFFFFLADGGAISAGKAARKTFRSLLRLSCIRYSHMCAHLLWARQTPPNLCVLLARSHLSAKAL